MISRQNPKILGVKVVPNLDQALEPFVSSTSNPEVFILGGGQIFKEALPLADRVYLTLIEKDFLGDVFFPEVNWNQFEKTFEESHSDPIPFRFINYDRKSSKRR